MKISRTVSFGVGVLVTLVLGGGTAYAATGGTFLLGKSNSATTPTSLTNSRGTALVLNSKTGTSPLKVNSTTKATNLNADRLDGLDSTKFGLATGQTNSIKATGIALDLSGDDIPDTIAAIATCPSGSRLTGGGGEDYTSNGVLYVNAPSDRTSWIVISTADPAVDSASDVDAYAVCYNPRGTVSGGEFRTTTSRFSTSQMGALKTRMAKKVH